MIADGNSNNDDSDGDAAVAATIDNERAAARWLSGQPSMILPVPGGGGAYDGERHYVTSLWHDLLSGIDTVAHLALSNSVM